jgi:hypothetical protein
MSEKHESSSVRHDVPASSDIDLLAAWPGCLRHSRTRPLEKLLVEGEKEERTRRGRKLLSTSLAFSGVNSGTRVVLM